MTHHWFPIKAASLLFLLSTLPLFGEDPAPATPAGTAPAQQLQAGAQPTATPAAPGQTTPAQPAPVAQGILSISPTNDAARFLAGLPVASGSKLALLTQAPSWQAHARAMNLAFSQLDKRQLNNIRTFRAENIAPVTQQSHTCLYLFSGPDFLYADAMFSDCSTFVLQGLEPVDPLPDLATVPPATLAGTLQNIQTSLDTLLSFSFFKTKNMREDLERSELKGVLPAIVVFMARTGKEITGIEYLSLDKAGTVVQGFQGATRGAKLAFTDSATGAQKVLYYFTSDLSDDALKRNPGLLRFCEGLGPANSLLKAASYLFHEAGFETVRNFLLQNSVAILQDDSGIPVHFFTPDKWTLRFFGIYTGPIELFKNFYQEDCATSSCSSPKPLTFGLGYRWSSRTSTMFLAVRKE